MKVDFNKLKTDISLPDFLLSLGWKFISGSSNSSPKMSNGSQTIVIKKNSENQFTYWDVHSSNVRGRSIIDVMQQHILDTTGMLPSLRETGEAIVRYINTNDIILPENSRFDVGNTELSPGEILTLLRQLTPYSGDYLQKRGISKETLTSPIFSDTFYIRTVKRHESAYQNVCVKMFDDKGIKAISQRNEEFKGILGRKFDSLAFSHHDASRPIDVLYIGESMVDCSSHYQLKNQNNPSNILYASTEGTLTEGQMLLLRKLMGIQSVKLLIPIFDNDKNGHKYTIWLSDFLHGVKTDMTNMSEEAIKDIAFNIPNVDFPLEKDWNDVLNVV